LYSRITMLSGTAICACVHAGQQVKNKNIILFLMYMYFILF
jgi:hypothetical protein